MELELRRPREEEYGAFFQAIASAHGGDLPAGLSERVRPVTELDRCLVALDGAQIVGTAEAIGFSLTVPGGALPAGGVTSVGVLPTHRRRGLLTRLMRRQLDDLRAWGEPLALLWASEGGIYHRFGYGLASWNARIEAERDRFALRHPAEREGRVRLVGHEEALGLLPAVYDRVRSVTPGFCARPAAWWECITLADDEFARSGAGPLCRAVVELGGRPEGYALYRVQRAWERGVPRSRLELAEAIAASPVAQRELWRYLFGVDLIETVHWRRLALDHPLLSLVQEPARLHLSVGDGLWLRLVDAAAALAGRAYAHAGTLRLGLIDAFCPWNEGSLTLDASPAGVAVTRGGEPELVLDVADLASVYLGGFTFAGLSRTGRVEERAPGALARADALFGTDRAPWSPESF
ncbi:MAG: GNAT family N-acetyltransferase [Thermoleophilia bacterium]|nr:GNAT family N-acetyltransferase [Thermoleophilia bacterium]